MGAGSLAQRMRNFCMRKNEGTRALYSSQNTGFPFPNLGGRSARGFQSAPYSAASTKSNAKGNACTHGKGLVTYHPFPPSYLEALIQHMQYVEQSQNGTNTAT